MIVRVLVSHIVSQTVWLHGGQLENHGIAFYYEVFFLIYV